jgi:hypothetical protein
MARISGEADLDIIIVIKEYVLWLEITVEDITLVAVRERRPQLEKGAPARGLS